MSESTAADTRGGWAIREWLAIYLKGVAMGAADTVPGVSGGTIAFITGIYERLIGAITALDARVLDDLRGLHRADGRQRFFGRLREMDVPFLIVLALGVGTSVVVVSRFVHTALEVARAGTFAFFFGLIAASAIVLYEHLSISSLGGVLAAVAGFLLAFLISGASSTGVLGHALPVVFLSGAIAITAMVLPGVSGAFILLLLGQYEYLTGVLKQFVNDLLGVVVGGDPGSIASGAAVVATFGVGAILGLLTVAHLVRRALASYRAATLSFLVSLMLGSLRLPVLEIADSVATWTPQTGATVLGAAVVGAGAVLALDYYTDDLSYA